MDHLRSLVVGEQRTSAITNVLVWFLFITNILSVSARLGTRYFVSKELDWGDGLLVLALTTSLAQCICISIAAAHGLGTSTKTLTQHDVDVLSKAEYASLPLLILTLALIKWSISVFIGRLTPSRTCLMVDKALRGLNVLWWLSATLLSLFQCSVPKVWDLVRRDHCIDEKAWWTYVVVVNIMTDVGSVGLLVWIIWRLHMSASKRVLILMVFMTRTLVVAALAAQLAIYRNTTPNAWLPTVMNEVVVSVSLITSCLPYLKPLMLSLESGIARVPDEPQELAFMGSSRNAINSAKFGSSGRESSTGGTATR